MALILPIVPTIANAALQDMLHTIIGTLALPITDAMFQRVAACLTIVSLSPLATKAEHGQFCIFLHEVEHAYLSCVLLQFFVA